MSIQNFPAALHAAIQQKFLEREFRTGLESTLTYRNIADLETFPANVGETITKTRKGLKAPTTKPLDPTTNTNLDNGLTPSGWTMEQYTLGVDMYGDTIDLNMVTQGVGIQDQFLHNAYTNGRQSMQSIDRIARDCLNAAYMSGNTKVKTTLGAPGPTIAVDDIRGFETVIANGEQVGVSSANKLVVVIGGSQYNVTGVTRDAATATNAAGTAAAAGNTSSVWQFGGISGTLTCDANVSTSDGTAGNPVVSFYAPTVLRVGARATTAGLQASDMFGMAIALDAVTQLRNNGVPTVDGFYECYLDNTSARQLFADGDFKELYRGTGASKEFREARVIELLDIRFKPTTEAIQQKIGAVNVHRPLVCGAGCMVEGVFADTAYSNLPKEGPNIIEVIDGIAMVTRAPMDRLQQIIAQSWYYIGGFVCPTDITADKTIIPTASNAMFKRAVLIEHGG